MANPVIVKIEFTDTSIILYTATAAKFTFPFVLPFKLFDNGTSTVMVGKTP